jgi:6-pyruvoyltetrahydropterin/6-carboxytetrahydropterin synthase
MPYRICKTFEIENGHMLSKHPDKCRFPHGHTRRVECVFVADTLDANEMVCDFKVVKELIGTLLEAYDHALCMNTDDPEYARLKAVYGERVIGFAHRDPTTEVLAETVYAHVSLRLAEYVQEESNPYPVRPQVRLERVRVWETSSSWAEYWA